MPSRCRCWITIFGGIRRFDWLWRDGSSERPEDIRDDLNCGGNSRKALPGSAGRLIGSASVSKLICFKLGLLALAAGSGRWHASEFLPRDILPRSARRGAPPANIPVGATPPLPRFSVRLSRPIFEPAIAS
jgi:hypothetical protein